MPRQTVVEFPRTQGPHSHKRRSSGSLPCRPIASRYDRCERGWVCRANGREPCAAKREAESGLEYVHCCRDAWFPRRARRRDRLAMSDQTVTTALEMTAMRQVDRLRVEQDARSGKQF